jgi:hypothetical protein
VGRREPFAPAHAAKVQQALMPQGTPELKFLMTLENPLHCKTKYLNAIKLTAGYGSITSC